MTNKDGHFVAAVTSMYQSLLESKTDCPHQWSFRCWQNSLGCCHDCRSSCHGPVPEDHDFTKENVAASCLCEAFPPVGAL